MKGEERRQIVLLGSMLQKAIAVFFLCKSLLFLLSKTANDEIASLEAGAGEKGIGNERRLVSVKKYSIKRLIATVTKTPCKLAIITSIIVFPCL